MNHGHARGCGHRTAVLAGFWRFGAHGGAPAARGGARKAQRAASPRPAGAPAAAVPAPLAQPGRLVCSAGLDPKRPGGGSLFDGG